jgi:hypothetical protein
MGKPEALGEASVTLSPLDITNSKRFVMRSNPGLSL